VNFAVKKEVFVYITHVNSFKIGLVMMDIFDAHQAFALFCQLFYEKFRLVAFCECYNVFVIVVNSRPFLSVE